MNPQRARQPELLDLGAYASLDVLRGNLHDMTRYARWLGIPRLVLAQLPTTLRSVLDIGCGLGDLLVHSARHLSNTGTLAVGLDRNADVLRLARHATKQPIHWLQADALRLPFAEGAFDAALCVHVLHHFDPPNAARVLAECARVARQRCVVVDLQRSAFGVLGAWLLTRITSRNPLTRIDGVRSARNAYTAFEAHALARAAGWSHFSLRATPVLWVLVHVRSGT